FVFSERAAYCSLSPFWGEGWGEGDRNHRDPLTRSSPEREDRPLPNGERWSLRRRSIANCRSSFPRSLFQPHVLVAVAAVVAVDHHGQAMDVGLPAGRGPPVEDDRAR